MIKVLISRIVEVISRILIVLKKHSRVVNQFNKLRSETHKNENHSNFNEIIQNLVQFLGSEENIESAITNGAIFYKEDIENRESLDYIFDHHDVDIVFNLATKALNYSFINPSSTRCMD